MCFLSALNGQVFINWCMSILVSSKYRKEKRFDQLLCTDMSQMFRKTAILQNYVHNALRQDQMPFMSKRAVY